MKTQIRPVLLASALLLTAVDDGVSGCVPGNFSPVACWKGEGDADSQCGGLPAAWVNTAAYIPGKVGSAFFLDRTNFLRVADADSLSFGVPASAFTVEAWVNPTVWTGTAVAKGSGAGTEYSLSLNRTNGSVVFTMALVDFTDPLLPPLMLAAEGGLGASNQWHHLAGVYQVGTALAVFLDGVRVGTTALLSTRAAQNTGSPLYLGRAGAPGQNLAGGLDEVYLHPVALSDEDIRSIYAAGSLGHCPPGCVTAPPGSVAWWPADGNTVDLTGLHPATLVNGATYAAGQVGLAFSFDGVDDYGEASDLGLPANAAPRTIECWVKPAFNARVPVIYGDFDANDAFYFVIRDSHAEIGNWGGDGEVSGTANITDGSWHHVAMTYDGGSSVRLYVDGVLDASATRTYATTLAGRIYFGSTVLGSGDRYRGLLDDVTIYNRALSASEILGIYAAGTYGKCKNFDSDGDGLSDAYELANGLNPQDPPPTGRDSDGDSLTDEDEANLFHTDPHNPDTDGDGEIDGMEVQVGTNPTDPDSVLRVFPPVRVPVVLGGGWRLCWTSRPGTVYEVQCADLRNNTASGGLTWISLGNVTADPRAAVTCFNDRSGLQCLYRVRLVGSPGTDTLAPIASPLQFLGYSPDGWGATFSIDVRDILGVARVELLDGNLVLGSATHVSGRTWRFTWNLRTLVANLNGRHYLRARAFDTAGNVGYSPTLAFDVSVGGGGNCLDVGPVRICADSLTLNGGVYSFSGHIRVNGITLNAGATLTASGAVITGAGGVNVPGVGTVLDGAFEINPSTGWLTVRPGTIPTYSGVVFNTRVRFTPRAVAINVFSGALQGGGAVTVQVPGHAYGDVTFDGGVTFDPVAARVAVSGTLTMGSAFSGSGTAVLNLADSTFTLSGQAQFRSSDGDVYSVSNGVATLRYALAVPTITVSGSLRIPDDITMQVQGTIAVDGAMNLTLSNGQGTIQDFGFTAASGTLTRPSGASAIITLQFSATLLHPSVTDYHVSGTVRSTGDIDIAGTGQATFTASLGDVTVLARCNPFNVLLRGNVFSHTVSNALSGTLLTSDYLKPVNFTGIMRADGSVDISGSSGPYTVATVPNLSAPTLTFEERVFAGCYQLYGRNNSTVVNVNLHLTRTADSAGGVSTLAIQAVRGDQPDRCAGRPARHDLGLPSGQPHLQRHSQSSRHLHLQHHRWHAGLHRPWRRGRLRHGQCFVRWFRLHRLPL